METRKNTTAGALLWTLAPVRTSPTSSVISEDVWEDEDEEEAEKDDDFVSQMNENGIIGLSDALEILELSAYCDPDSESNPNMCPGPITLDDADPRGCERDTPEELSYRLSKHCSLNAPQGEDVQILSPFEDSMDTEEAHMMDCKKDGEEAGTRKDQKRKKTKPPRITTGLSGSYISKGEIEEISSSLSCSAPLLAMGPATVADPHCPISQPASPFTALTFPHLLHFSAEEIAAGPGIDAENLPEMSFTESPPESHRSHVSLKSSSRCDEVKLGASLQPAAVFSKEGLSNHYSGPLKASHKSGKPHKLPTPSPRKMRQHSPEATCSKNLSLNAAKVDSLKFKHRTASPDKVQKTPKARSNAAEMDESRKGPLSYRTPDFSKVEPKVHFPKDGYSPPKSKHPSKRRSLSPEPPFGFKSPADIVKEVLLKTIAASPASSDSYKPPTSAPNSTVPQEFRCRQQATTLLDQLQEDYNRLLTKYAEAENTIDRLRLQAKVNLYSDPPKPGHLVQSGLNRDSSQVMVLDFSQAQRAAFSSASLHPNGHSNNQRSSSARPSTRSPDPQVGEQLAKIIYSMADKFLQQLQTFKDLLKSKQLLPCDQMTGLSQLAVGLNSLERGYLLAKDEHKVLLQRGAQISHFDPERELEGLIFQCGLCMEELKEQVEQMQQEQPTCVAPPSPPPHPAPSSVPSEGGETLTHPQSPPVPLLVDPGEAAAMEVSSASEESHEEEETLNSLYLKPLNGKQRHVEQDCITPMDHYHSFKELPNVQDSSQREGASLSAALRSDMQPADGERERQSRRTEGLEVQKSLPQRKDISEHLDSPPVKQQASRSSSPSRRGSTQSTTFHSSRRRLKVGKSHSSSLSSLGEITALEKRNSKLQTGSSGVLSQDGIISPETDSGFVCSESSRLTPAAAPSPLHQRASESVSVPQEGILGNPQIGPVSVPSPASSSSHSQVAMEPRSDSRISRDQQRRTWKGQRRRTSSCSPQRCIRQTEQPMADDETSESGLESYRSHAEDNQNDLYTESINSLHNSSRSSSPAGRHPRGYSVRPLSSDGAIQKLQAEVARLRERIKTCVRTPPSSVRAAPSAQENYTHNDTSTPRIRSGERWCDVRGRRDRWPVDEVEESTLRQTTRKRTPSAHRQKTQLDIMTGSELSSPDPQPLVSRCTQTSTAAPDTNTVRSRTHPRRHLGVSETADEPDSRSRRAFLCPQCLSRHQGRSGIGGDREPVHSFCSHCCLLCGHTEPSRSTEPDSPTRISCHSCSPDRDRRYFAAAASPALLQYIPVYPPPLLMYSSPLYVSPSHSTTSGVRGRWKKKERTRSFQSSDKQHSMNTSLNRAIGAAQHMKHTSGHMARCLATGVQYQELLTQSCSYQTAHSAHRQHRLSNLRMSTSPGAEGTECRTR